MNKLTKIEELLADIAPHLKAPRRRELAEQWLGAINPDKPMLYKNRPAGEDFLTFWRREYFEPGRVNTMSYRKLKLTDPAAASQYASLNQKGLLAEELQMPKEKKRLNKHERDHRPT